MPTVLGLDLGPNSIGWALIEEDSQRIIDAGVRVFPEGVAKFDTAKEISRNENRRIARGMRRQIARRGRRKRILRDALIDTGFFPADSIEQDELYQQNPYELRARALDEQLTPYQIGRILLHLNQRRGFLSNRKNDRGNKEIKGMLEEISQLAHEINNAGARTLGEYLYHKYESFDHARRADDGHVRNRHTRRDMLEFEFEAIWDAQARHHPELLTTKLRYGSEGKASYPCKPRTKAHGQGNFEAFGLHGLIFFQRKMYWSASVIGSCELEPKEKRCPRFDRHAQQFRLLQELNNLRYIDPDHHQECRLTGEQRTLLLDHLSTREKASFDDIRKKLDFLDTVKFNLERGERSNLKGMVVDWLMARAAGKSWHHRPEDEKDAVVRMLLDNERDDDSIADRLVSEFEFTAEYADAALGVDIPAGYASLSLKAIDKLLPHLQRGLVYQAVSDPEQSALHAAGYTRRDERRRRFCDRLPPHDKLDPSDCPIGEIPNPVVTRTLVELRKVVNAVIREYDKPDAVHVEMARSVQMGPKARKEYNRRSRQREADRDRAADEIRTYRERFPGQGLRVNRDSILLFLLWEEQNHQCIYCQQTISQQHLFSGEVDVDHILPYSRCLDDSQQNKVVAHRHCNHDKGNRSPYEWLADSEPRRYEQICQQAASLMQQRRMRYGKYRKFLQKEIDLDQFVARQLADTGYIARATAEYLRLLFDKPHHVLGLKGQQTAELRRQWGLNNILRNDDLDLKNREDHRHHAVDAIVVALTNRRRLNELARATVEVTRLNAQTREFEHRQLYAGRGSTEPWNGFRQDVEEVVNDINVSHRAEKKVAGALHEDTFYGSTEQPGVFVVRKPLENLSPNEIPLIRDTGVRKVIEERLATHGIEVGRGKGIQAKLLKQVLCDSNDPILIPPSKQRLKRDPQAKGIPVRKVRVQRNELTIQPIRRGRDDVAHVKPGATHHLCIFEWKQDGRTKRAPVFVTQLEAINRVKNREQVIQRTPPPNHPTIPPDAHFIMSLSRGEAVLADWKGEQMLLVFKTAASTQGQIYFAEHTDARRSADQTKFVAKANTLEAKKITVDPLGRVRWAND